MVSPPIKTVHVALAERAYDIEIGADSLSTAGAFWFPMQPLVWVATDRFGLERLRRFWPEFLELAERDVRSGEPAARAEATAIKVLAARRA